MRPCQHQELMCVKGEPYVEGRDCKVCWLDANDDVHHCIFNRVTEGPSLGRKVLNFSKALSRRIVTGGHNVEESERQRRLAICHACHLFADGECRHQDCGCIVEKKAAWSSETCPLGKWVLPPIRFDHKNLFPQIPGLRFNSSLIAYRDGYLLAFRTGWCNSEIFLVELDRKFRPLGVKHLNLFHPHNSNYGREDPRLFLFRGQIHVGFTGVVGGRNGGIYTNQMYARLDARLKVERIYTPQYWRRNVWEKNWQFFDQDGQLYAVYTIAPHRILAIDGNNAELVHHTQTMAPWSSGEMRGGASPVRVGDEWWSFFHSSNEPGGHKTYYTGVYTFEAKPPFRVLRITPSPILVADRRTNIDNYCSVVFPGGAVRVGDKWIVAHGIHDRYTELHTWNAADIEAKLVALPST